MVNLQEGIVRVIPKRFIRESIRDLDGLVPNPLCRRVEGDTCRGGSVERSVYEWLKGGSESIDTSTQHWGFRADDEACAKSGREEFVVDKRKGGVEWESWASYKQTRIKTRWARVNDTKK
ncbi:hypothetical protein CR513_10740, partial [Mucuna pruriens]